RDPLVTGVQTCALPIWPGRPGVHTALGTGGGRGGGPANSEAVGGDGGQAATGRRRADGASRGGGIRPGPRPVRLVPSELTLAREIGRASGREGRENKVA